MNKSILETQTKVKITPAYFKLIAQIVSFFNTDAGEDLYDAAETFENPITTKTKFSILYKLLLSMSAIRITFQHLQEKWNIYSKNRENVDNVEQQKEIAYAIVEDAHLITERAKEIPELIQVEAEATDEDGITQRISGNISNVLKGMGDLL